MTPEYLVRFHEAVGEAVPVELLGRSEHRWELLSSGNLDLPEKERCRLEGLLTSDARPADSAVEADGLALYGRLRAALGSPLDDALNGTPKRIHLELTDDGPHGVPWEIMVWPRPAPGGRLFTAVTRIHRLGRVSNPDWAFCAGPPCGPLRLLIAVGQTDQGIEAEEEVEEIQARLQSMQATFDVDVIVPTGNRGPLYDRIKHFRPHILHFVGHAVSTPRPALQFTGWKWTAEEIGADLGNTNLQEWCPNVVFLNACRTGSPLEGRAAVAGAFFLGGVAAMVAMQGDIRGNVAGRLAGVFYSELARGETVDEALFRARADIAVANQRSQAAFPTLTSRYAPSQTIPSFVRTGPLYDERYARCPLLDRLKAFVNQTDARRRLSSSFWPQMPRDARRPFVLLRGHPKCGKSTLCAWLLDVSLRHGYRVRYVTLHSIAGGVGCAEMLRLLWVGGKGSGNSPLTDPLPAMPPELNLGSRVRDESTLFPIFLDRLRSVAAERPVTIVVDQIAQKMDPGSFWILWEQIFVPIARHQVPGVQMVLSLTQEDDARYSIDQELSNRPELNFVNQHVVLEGLSPAEFRDRFIEYATLRADLDPSARQAWRGLVDHAPLGDRSQVSKFVEIFDALALAGLVPSTRH